MLSDIRTTRFHLQRNEMARFADARDARVAVVSGVAWITVDGDPRDHVLEAGDSFVIDSAQPVIVFALQGPAAVELQPRPGAAPGTRAPAPRSWTSGRLRPAGAA
ncbi:DUF2917 domain-containing protein [Piscinibacter sp. XHJ-5]|uniref:DUF2917 domain-containing protein n=1 Tax=Piscinibacter sp. XHJ-5 TaxID=3037797 RepID=UPI0024535AA4|nr:DUF2917 domain-containing protein [Piscinibacter sp. XHJ-5]